jgi:poly-gamma-glutamate synthesis protein (capsule biosynthesis protein)
MHPENVACLTAAQIDVCTLANNHVLDYGRRGLIETLDTLAHAGLKTAGAGRNLVQARKPAIVPLPTGGRIAVFAAGSESSGILPSWSAGERESGVVLLPDLSLETATDLVAQVKTVKHQNDPIVASIHWGTNWGYDVSPDQVRFAHWLIDGGVDIVHGHSSHHPRPIEVYRGRLVLYGSGDFLNDYEGIAGYEPYRSDLTLMYFATMETTGDLTALSMVPMQLRQLRLRRASLSDARWLRDSLARASAPFGSEVELGPDGLLGLRWSRARRWGWPSA